jgi:hypothetical protein
MTRWTHDLLDALRQIGDPPLDGGTWVKRPYAQAADDEPTEDRDGRPIPETIRLLRTWRRAPYGARPVRHRGDDLWTHEGEAIDVRQLETAHSLFAAYGGEIGASLLLASIPNAYAAGAGAAVLGSTGELSSHARRRIGETAQLVVDVLFPEGDRIRELQAHGGLAAVPALPTCGRGYATVRTTRLTHAVIRQLLLTKGWKPNTRNPDKPYDDPAAEEGQVPSRVKLGVPINQEDLLGTLGTFTVTTFEVMEKLGVPWNDEAEHAYLMLWDRVGELLGIGTKDVWSKLPRRHKKGGFQGPLRPRSVAEARALQDLIRERVWPPVAGERPGPFDNADGRVLVRALLDELQEAMPRGLVRLPLVVMRYLVHPSAHELLGLGGGGLPDSVMRWPSVERFIRGPAYRPGTTLIERTMRIAATDISRRAFIHFIREREENPAVASFRFPGVRESDTVISAGRGGGGPG